MKFLRELCLVLTEICRSFIAIVTMKVRVCFPQLVTEIQFRSPYLFSIMQFLAIPLYQMWQFHYTKCGNSVIPNVDCSATIRGTLHEGGLEPSREILEVRIMKVMQRPHLNDNLHQLREAFLSDEERKETQLKEGRGCGKGCRQGDWKAVTSYLPIQTSGFNLAVSLRSWKWRTQLPSPSSFTVPRISRALTFCPLATMTEERLQ